jgi:hypothetical protein
VKLFFLFLFSFFLLLPFSIVFVAADNILKELSSLPFVFFVCLFFGCLGVQFCRPVSASSLAKSISVFSFMGGVWKRKVSN